MVENHFGELTARMSQFRDALLDASPQVDVERAIITTQVYRENAD